jgi:hypothetical protein
MRFENPAIYDTEMSCIEEGNHPCAAMAATDGSTPVRSTAGPVGAGTFAGASDNVVVKCTPIIETGLLPQGRLQINVELRGLTRRRASSSIWPRMSVHEN